MQRAACSPSPPVSTLYSTAVGVPAARSPSASIRRARTPTLECFFVPRFLPSAPPLPPPPFLYFFSLLLFFTFTFFYTFP